MGIPPLLYIYHPKDGMSITGSFSACFNQAAFLFRKPSLIHNAQFAVDLAPVPDGGSPSFRSFKCSQIQGFQQSCIAREHAPLTVQFPVSDGSRATDIILFTIHVTTDHISFEWLNKLGAKLSFIITNL